MPGGILQLAATGAADVYLTRNPEFSYFKAVYRRYHNFAIESIRQNLDNIPNFGVKTRTQISIKGDLLSEIYLRFSLPALTLTSGTFAGWTNSIARALIKKVEIQFNGYTFDTLYDIPVEIWDALSIPTGKDGYQLMTGTYDFPVGLQANALTPTTYFAKLPFWFTKHIGAALPLAAMQYSKIELIFEFRDFIECLHFDGATPPTTVSITDAAVYCDYIYLEDEERIRFSKAFETDRETVTDPDTGISQYIDVDRLDNFGNKIPMSFTYLIDQWQFTGEVDINAGRTVHNADISDFNLPCSELIFVFRETDSEANNDWFNYSRRADNVSFFLDARLTIDNQDRFATQTEDYFRLLQPHNYHTRSTVRHVNVYSFSLDPESYQPGGTLNFSHLDSAILHFNMRPGNPECKFYVYARNYNIVVITSGIAGLAWSS